MGIGVSFFTETVGAGPRRDMDIAGLGMADGAQLTVHPTGKAVLRISVQTQGQGHETTFAQIVAEELGIPPEDIAVVHGDTDETPFGLGTYGSRSTPVSGAAAAVVSRKIRDKARLIAAAMLEASPADLEWEKGRFYVKGDPSAGKTIQEIAFGAYSTVELPDDVEGQLEAVCTYNPSNMTYPFGAYIAVVDVDAGTGHVRVRRFIAVDDCGTRINPMIIEGQIHGGLAEGIGIALMEFIGFDEDGNCLNGSFMDYLIPTSLEVPDFEVGFTVTPSPHHPIGAKGVGESAQRRLPAGDRQRHRRRAEALRRAAHGHALLARARVGGHAGPGRAAGVTMAHELWRAAEALSAARIPFVVATVVRVAKPASVRPGDAAIVHRDGRIEGFVGGACSTSTVRLHALRVLETEEPLLLRIRPVAGEGSVVEGVVTVDNPCLSGGELEIFLEPRLPAPLLRVIGDSPVAAHLARLGAPLGFEVVAGGAPEPGDAACVVASHGDADEGATEAALLAGIPYVGLVASPRRGAAVVDGLRGHGLCESVIDRLRTPAGLDIGSRTHAEIALSILAEIVQRRRTQRWRPWKRRRCRRRDRRWWGRRRRSRLRHGEPPGAGWPRVEHDGVVYGFCCPGCQRRFERDPARFLASA